jgi:hypothetical protein
MAQDFEGIGRTAGEYVLRRLADMAAPLSHHVYAAHLKVRRSSLTSLGREVIFPSDITYELPMERGSATPTLTR